MVASLAHSQVIRPGLPESVKQLRVLSVPVVRCGQFVVVAVAKTYDEICEVPLEMRYGVLEARRVDDETHACPRIGVELVDININFLVEQGVDGLRNLDRLRFRSGVVRFRFVHAGRFGDQKMSKCG